MLKSTIQNNHNVDIAYVRLIAFLKQNGKGFVQKKSEVFNPEDVRKFLVDAPDDTFLDLKVDYICRTHPSV